MFKYVALFALLAVAYGGYVPFESPLGATLLPKVNIAPTQVTVVKQPYTIEQREHVYRPVPVPVRAVAYTAPQIVAPQYVAAPHIVASPQLLAARAIW